LQTYILPLPKSAEDEEAWVDRFLLVYSLLEPRDRAALRRLANIEGSCVPFGNTSKCRLV
jgi:hypothetical protein